MPTVKLCSFNAEWMNDWFTPDAQPVALLPSFTKDGQHNDTNTTAGRVANLVRSIDPDVIAIQEAPSRPEEMLLFIATYLSDGGVPIYQCTLGDSGGSQKLALLYKPGSVDNAGLAPHSSIQDLIDPWMSDIDGDGFLDEYHFTRIPLVVNLVLGGNPLQVIVLHTKSNFINNGEQMWNDPSTHQQYVVGALKNRRRISSEAMRVRRYLDKALEQDSKVRIVVVGDMNDGPGMDYFEANYLTHNVIDIIVGSAFVPENIFRHAQHDVPPADRYTCVFNDFVTKQDNKQMLLDHMLLSPGLVGGDGLHKVPGSGAVCHGEYSAQVADGGAKREDRPSDHRPVSVQLEY